MLLRFCYSLLLFFVTGRVSSGAACRALFPLVTLVTLFRSPPAATEQKADISVCFTL